MVPVKSLLILLFLSGSATLPGAQLPENHVDHSIFSHLLSHSVSDGLVDYKTWKADNQESFQQYLSMLRDTNPGALDSQEERLAFWINAYNAFIIQGVLKRYPLKTIRPRKLGLIPDSGFWQEKAYTVNGKLITLNSIEHEILRQEFNEPRIHFAIVCASIGCPKLRNTAFSGSDVRVQLEDAARNFITDPDKVIFNPASRTLTLSKIFDWFRSDFENDAGSVYRFLERYLPALSQVREEDVKIRYSDYDWNLNEQQ